MRSTPAGRLWTNLENLHDAVKQQAPPPRPWPYLLGRPRALRYLYEGALLPGDGLQIELGAAVHLAGTADFREGLPAFHDKRPPHRA